MRSAAIETARARALRSASVCVVVAIRNGVGPGVWDQRSSAWERVSRRTPDTLGPDHIRNLEAAVAIVDDELHAHRGLIRSDATSRRSSPASLSLTLTSVCGSPMRTTLARNAPLARVAEWSNRSAHLEPGTPVARVARLKEAFVHAEDPHRHN